MATCGTYKKAAGLSQLIPQGEVQDAYGEGGGGQGDDGEEEKSDCATVHSLGLVQVNSLSISVQYLDCKYSS